MQILVLAMFAIVILVPYLTNGDFWHRGAVLPGSAGFLPELTSVLAVLAVIAFGIRDGFSRVRAAYWLAFGALLLIVICGAVINHVGSGPILAGLRLYLRGVPWFFIPAVYAFSNAQLREQMRWLLIFCLLEVPISIEQRIKTTENTLGFVAVTGDWTTGTFGDSGILSVFLISAAAVLAALYVKKEVRMSRFLPLLALMLLPTMINETKVTVFLAPIGLLAALVIAAPAGVKLKLLSGGALLILIFGSIFVQVYDKLNEGREYSESIEAFFSNSDDVKTYLGAEPGAGGEAATSRVGGITVSLSKLAADPARLMFGYGVGNASESALGPYYTGEYGFEFHDLLQSAAARTLLEMGCGGLVLLLVVWWLIFRDGVALSRGSGLMAGVGAGWAGVVALMVPAMFYALLESFPPLTYLFWYFSGLVAAQRMRLEMGDSNAAST